MTTDDDTGPLVIPRAAKNSVKCIGGVVEFVYAGPDGKAFVVRVGRGDLIAAMEPIDDPVIVDRHWIAAVLPATSPDGRRGNHPGPFGTVAWALAEVTWDANLLFASLNGAPIPLAGMTRGRFRRLLDGLGIDAARPPGGAA